MSSDSEQHQDSSNAPRSRTYYMHIENNNGANVPVVVIAPNGTKTPLAAGATYNSSANGVHTVVAPGTPDVVYFKLHYINYGNMSTEQGPLNGAFTIKIVMR